MNKTLIISLLILVLASCKKNSETLVLQDNFSFAKQPEDVLKAYSTGYFKVEKTVYGPASMPSLQDTVLYSNFYMRIKADSLIWTDSTTRSYSMSWVYDVEKQTQIYYRMDLKGMTGGTTDNFDLRPLEMKNGYLVLYNSWYSGTWYFLKRIE